MGKVSHKRGLFFNTDFHEIHAIFAQVWFKMEQNLSKSSKINAFYVFFIKTARVSLDFDQKCTYVHEF